MTHGSEGDARPAAGGGILPGEPLAVGADFRVKSTLGVGLGGVALLTPFSINHLVQGRTLLGVGTALVVLAMGAIALLGRRGHYRPWLVFALITPVILVFLFEAFREQGVIGALWCFPAILLFYFTLPERQAWISNAALYAMAVPMAWSIVETPIAARVAATLLGVSMFSAIFVRVIAVQQRALEARAVSDALTGLLNRVLLPATLEQAMEQARRTGLPMTLLAFDLDEFKEINDRHGHQAGDAVLQGVAEILRSRIRRSDRAFRLGGEEFLAFLYGTDKEQGLRVAEDLRGAVEAKTLIPDRSVTVSVGIAAYSNDPDWESWVRRCDDNLYGAKAKGRNLVVG
jgi:diguanylate cyclase (GGDEF)-like protein